jgi:hypothetical protein
MRRAVGLALAGLLGVGVIVAIILSVGGGSKDTPAHVVLVRGVIGSEKKPFFDDRRVQAEFRKHGLRVEVDTAGSRQIATTVDLKSYDFAFPSGVPAAREILSKEGTSTSYTVFYTPMVMGSWKPIAALLEKAGVATPQGGWDTFDVAKYLQLVAKNTRWTDLPGNTTYPAGKSILVTSTDVRTSNSAANYLSIASYVANGNNVVENDAQGDAVIPKVAPIFLRQGFTAASSEEPFDDYLAIGIGKTPLVFIYEAQFLARVFANDGSITPDMTLMYPDPDVLSKHVVVPLDPKGDRIGRLLLSDPVLQRLAAVYGFRTNDPRPFQEEIRKHPAAKIPATIVDLIEPPSYDALEHMIRRIEQLYNQSQGGGTT